MANDIYTTTLGGLAELVSPRVAEGVLTRALRAVDRTPDDVDARTMSRLIRGRVRRELQRTLPPKGLRRSLARVERRMLAVDDRPWKAKKAEVAPAEPQPLQESAPAAARSIEWRREPADDADPAQRMRAFPIADDLPEPRSAPWPAEAGAEAAAGASVTTDVVRERAPRPPVEVRRPTSSAPPPTRAVGTVAPTAATARAAAAPAASPTGPAIPPRRPRTLPATAVDRLASMSGVRQWVWTSEGATQGQGEGPDPATVASDVRATIALLSRHGRVRSLHVHHDTGHVLVGVSDRAALVVSGDEGVNLGSVYTTFRALEEAP